MNEFLIAGLGNIGADCAGTRHNIGFDIAVAFVHKHGGHFSRQRYADVAKIKVKDKGVVCIAPTTSMNLSGTAVKFWLEKEKISLQKLLVIVDDIALPLNRFPLRPGGSDSGHKGLTNIREVLDTENYPRLRFGIGNDFPKGKQVDFVSGKWHEREISVIKLKIEKTVGLIESFVEIGLEQTMNIYNKLIL